jgi:hypothetical protein
VQKTADKVIRPSEFQHNFTAERYLGDHGQKRTCSSKYGKPPFFGHFALNWHQDCAILLGLLALLSAYHKALPDRGNRDI